MAILDIAPVLGRAKDRVYRVGIELEGGWRNPPKGVQIEHDGSVWKDPATERQMPLPVGVVDRHGDQVIDFKLGEIISPILEVERVEPWMRKYYPSDVNNTCGLHVHVSFRNALHYQLLMTPDYQETMMEYLGRWGEKAKIPKAHCLWERIRGENVYCQLVFFADKQVCVKTKNYRRDFEGHRYTAINYCHGMHGTIETRVLPMMGTVDLSVSAVKEVLSITNGCLAKLAKREQKFRADVIDHGEVIRETIDIRV